MVDWDLTQRRILRQGLALYLLIYHFIFLSQAAELWGQAKMIHRALIPPHLGSLLFFNGHDALVYSVVIALLILSGFLFLKDLSWTFLALIFLLHLSLINANPTLIHEPHQIAQLMIVVLALNLPNPQKLGSLNDKTIGRIWLAAVLLYYFFSGLKKIPDPNWLQGRALQSLLLWPGLSQDNTISRTLAELPLWMIATANYTVLMLELSAPIAFFNLRYRNAWVIAILLMHGAIALTLDVGYFSWLMPVAVLSCCDLSTRKTLKFFSGT